MGEAKLAINNLYNRISGRSKTHENDLKSSNANNGIPSQNTAVSKSPAPGLEVTAEPAPANSKDAVQERSMAEKLHAIQNRLLDLSHVATKVEQFMAKDRERAKIW